MQRTLGIGYGRAGRLIGFMADDGIVGAYNGSNAREVLYTLEQWEEMKEQSALSDQRSASRTAKPTALFRADG